jgi:DNA-binding LacI/PurR family transcriptional regulator/DNA-binding transcriptional regulator YhcF (GntR family)
LKRKTQHPESASSPHSLQTALAYIESVLRTVSSGNRLPPVRAMAVTTGISNRYLCRAVKMLAEQQRVAIVRGKGIFAGAKPSVHRSVLKRKRERIKELVLKAILGDVFADGVVPPLRRLRLRYNVSYELLRAVLNDLLNDGIIEHHLHGYRVNIPGRLRSYSSLLFIGPGDTVSGKAIIYNERLQGLHVQLESDCAANGIHFAQRSFPGKQIYTPGCLGELSGHIGFIVWPYGMRPEFVGPIIGVLAKSKRPVALIDELGTWTPPRDLEHHSLLKIISIAGFTAGKQAGRLLLGLGHRSAAYFSLYHEQFWSRERLRGVRDEFGKAGFAGGVHEETMGQPAAYDTESQQPFGPLSLHIDSLFKSLPEKYHQRYGSAFWNVQFSAMVLRDINHWSTALAPQFQRMLDSGATAWLTANTVLAVPALHFLEDRGIRVPDHLTLFSFDNTQEAYQNDLTSYDFDFPGMARDAFSYILYPSAPRFSGCARIEHTGLVIIRGSSGKASSEHARTGK